MGRHIGTFARARGNKHQTAPRLTPPPTPTPTPQKKPRTKKTGVAVAEKAIEYGLYEEAFEIFRKIGRKVEAVRVLLRQGGAEGAEISAEGVARAHEFASKVDEPPVWSELAAAHLERRETADAIAAYLRAQDASAYAAVIDAVRAAAPPAASGAPADPAAASAYADLVRFLQMARKRARDPKVDTELVYALARTNALGELDAFVHGQHSANVAQAADRCFDEGLFEAARALYAHIPNWGRLASALVRLHRFQEAVDAARKANAPKTWKEVCFACVEEGEGKLAQLCGLHIVVNADELDEVRFLVLFGFGGLWFLFFGGGRRRAGACSPIAAARTQPKKTTNLLPPAPLSPPPPPLTPHRTPTPTPAPQTTP